MVIKGITLFKQEEKPFMFRSFLIACLICILLSGCKQEGKNTCLAQIGEREISADQFDAYLEFKRLHPNNDTNRDKLLDQYLEREQLASAIENQTTLLDSRLTDAELNEFKKEMLISRYFEKYLNDTVSEQALKNYYTTHAADFEQRQVKVAHILVRTSRKMTEIERQAKLTKAQDAYAKIHGGKAFEDIAKDYSEDANSANKGGEIGWIREGSIDARFSQVSFNTKEGEISEPFESAFGYHVLKVLKAPAIVKQPFERVSGDIRYILRNKAKQAETERLMSALPLHRCGKK